MLNLATAKANVAVFGDRADFVAFTLPMLISLVLAPVLYIYVPGDTLPLAAYIILVGVSDVGHVWTTYFRTHLDSGENSRRPLLYNGMILFNFGLAFAIQFWGGDALFWTLLGYFAIYHFAKQQYGLLTIAKVRAKDFANFTLDKWLLYLGALCPLALWHIDETRRFDWFMRDDPFLYLWWRKDKDWTQSDFDDEHDHAQVVAVEWAPLGTIRSTLQLAVVTVWIGTVFLFMARYGPGLMKVALRGGNRMGRGEQVFPTLKCLIILYSWISWAFGVLCPHKVIALCFLNLFHAFPSFIIMYAVLQNRWTIATQPPMPAQYQAAVRNGWDAFCKWLALKRAKGFWIYFALLAVIGLAEETLWESLVWQDYTASYWSFEPSTAYNRATYCIIVAILTLPQSVHYALDAYIWKQGKDTETGEELNPGLKHYLALAFT